MLGLSENIQSIHKNKRQLKVTITERTKVIIIELCQNKMGITETCETTTQTARTEIQQNTRRSEGQRMDRRTH